MSRQCRDLSAVLLGISITCPFFIKLINILALICGIEINVLGVSSPGIVLRQNGIRYIVLLPFVSHVISGPVGLHIAAVNGLNVNKRLTNDHHIAVNVDLIRINDLPVIRRVDSAEGFIAISKAKIRIAAVGIIKPDI